MENKLKPCPFCGGEAELKKAGGNVWVECKKCLCGTAFASGASPTSTLVEVVTSDWNRRCTDGT